MIVILLAGCAGPPRRPPTLRIRLAAAADVNPDPNGRPSPVLLRIYQLAAPGDFQDAGFFRLYDHEKDVLGADAVTRTVLILLPGQTREIVEPLESRTRVVAVLAAYRDIDHARWRAMRLLPDSGGGSVSIDVGRAAVRMRDDRDGAKLSKAERNHVST